MAIARHPRPKELEDASLEQIMDRYVARYADRRADWAAFEDAKIEGFRRAQHNNRDSPRFRPGGFKSIQTGAVGKIEIQQNQIHAAYSLTDKESIGNLSLEAGDEKLVLMSSSLEEIESEIRMSWMPSSSETEPMFRASLGQPQLMFISS